MRKNSIEIPFWSYLLSLVLTVSVLSFLLLKGDDFRSPDTDAIHADQNVEPDGEIGSDTEEDTDWEDAPARPTVGKPEESAETTLPVFAESTDALESPALYTLRTISGEIRIGLFDPNGLLLRVLETPIFALPIGDQERINTGCPFATLAEAECAIAEIE